IEWLPNVCLFFFFQAEDGIRDRNVTGVQTCALPISTSAWKAEVLPLNYTRLITIMGRLMGIEPTNVGTTIRCVNHFATTAKNKKIGRASCRERAERKGVAEYKQNKEREHRKAQRTNE